MNYWPVYTTNLAECGVTFVDYMDKLREPGRLTAERVHGIEGAVENHTGFTVHTENNPFGMTAPTNAQEYGWNPALDEFVSCFGSLEEVYEHKDEIYYYPNCEDMTDVAYYFIDELQVLGEIPPLLQNYINYEAYGRELSIERTFIETSRGICEIPY